MGVPPMSEGTRAKTKDHACFTGNLGLNFSGRPVSCSSAKSAMKNSATPILVVLFLFGGAIAGLSWLMQSPAPPPPAPVAAPTPKPRPAAPVANLPPPPDNPPDSGFDPNDPQVQAFMQQRILDRYGDLFDDMNLTPEQQAAVTDLLVQQRQAAGAIYRNAYQGGDSANVDPAQLQQQVEQATAGVTRTLQATLGTRNYQLLQERDAEIRQSYQNAAGPGG